VYDVKPVVPFDSPREGELKVPRWVIEDDDEMQGGVTFSENAKVELKQAVEGGLLSPHYNPKGGEAEVLAAMDTIKEVLQQDPRQSHKRGGDSTTYNICFCKIFIEFTVEDESGCVVRMVGKSGEESKTSSSSTDDLT